MSIRTVYLQKLSVEVIWIIILLMRADWKVADDDSLLLTLEDSLWARNRAGELREWIQMVFYDRCAISIPVAVSFKERDTTVIEEEKNARRGTGYRTYHEGQQRGFQRERG